MKLEALEIFCEVVRHQSFSRGGAALGVSQSAASQIIAGLEETLGFRLINRRRRPFELTAEGRIYHRGCHDLLERHRCLLDEIREKREDIAGTVRVASIYSAGLHTLSRYIREFMARYARSRVRLEYLHPAKVYDAVLDDEADLGVVSYAQPHRDLEILPWLDEEMVVVCPVGHRLATLPEVRIADLEGQEFVAFDRELRIRREIDRTLRRHHVSVSVVSEFDNIETIKQAVEIASAVSVLPHASIERDLHRGTLVERHLADVTLRRPVAVVHRRDHTLPATARRFVNALLEDPAGVRGSTEVDSGASPS